MEWEDCTNYSKYDKDRIPTTFDLKFPSGLRLMITKGHIYYKGKWVMHCFNVGIDTYLLNVKAQKEAETKAMAIVKAKIQKWHDELAVI